MTISKEQLLERRKYIGASDCASVLGMSRWGTPLSIWAEKTEQVELKEREDLHLTLGTRLEEVVAELFEKKTGKKVHRVNDTVYHKQHKFIACNLDRRVVGEDADLECKTASGWSAKEFEGDEIPREYILQCYHSMAVTGRKKMYLAVLIGNQDFKIKEILADKKVQDDIIKKEVYFWNTFVIPRAMPTMILSGDTDALNALFPSVTNKDTLLLDDTANALSESLEALKSDAKMLKDTIEKTQNELKALLKDCETGTTDKWIISWKDSTYSWVDTEMLETKHPDVFKEVYKTKPIRKFHSKKIKENKEKNNV